jgi:hypothetical protein
MLPDRESSRDRSNRERNDQPEQHGTQHAAMLGRLFYDVNKPQIPINCPDEKTGA